MLYFDESTTPRVLPRTGSKGYSHLVIADDVFPMDTVDFGFDGKSIVLVRSEVQENPDECTEITLLVKEFGVYGSHESEIEVIPVGEYMLVTVKKGSILVRFGDTTMTATVGIDESKLPRYNPKYTYWVNLNKIMGSVKMWLGEYASLCLDYCYVIVVKNTSSDELVNCLGGKKKMVVTGISVRKPSSGGCVIDLTCGESKKITEQLQKEAYKNELKRQAELLALDNAAYESGFDYDPDDYDDDSDAYDEEEDDDFDYDGCYF